MGEAIGPGDYVECLHDDRDRCGNRLLRGQLYVCDSIVPAEVACGLCGDEGAGLGLQGQRGAIWCACIFRPIYRRKAGAFDHLKVIVGNLVRA